MVFILESSENGWMNTNTNTNDGTIYLCLGQDEKLELRPYLRGGATDAELERLLREAIELKPERHTFKERPMQVMRFMSQTGG